MLQQTDTLILDTGWDGQLADSLLSRTSVVDIPALAAPVDAADVFGAQSTLHPPTAFDLPAQPGLFPDMIYMVPIICLLIGYLIYVLIYGGRILPFLRLAVSSRREDPDPEEHIRMFSSFVNGLWVGTWFMLAIVAARAYILWMPTELDGRLSYYFHFLITAGVMVFGMAASLLYQLIISASGALTLNRHMSGRLLAIKRFTFVSFGIVSTPLALIFSLAPPEWAIWAGCALLLMAVVYLGYLLYRTARLFFQQKVSILFWFLYLCTVEAMPYVISVVALLRGAHL